MFSIKLTTFFNAVAPTRAKSDKSSYHVLTWKLQHLHLFLALILVSFTTSHAGDFDIESYGFPVRSFKITPTMTFRRREVGSLQPVLGGGIWILAHHEAPFQRGLGRDFSNAPYDASLESKDRYCSRSRNSAIAYDNIEHMDVAELEEDENPPLAEDISDERMNRFHRDEYHKASDYTFRISISISWLNRLWGRASHYVGSDDQPVFADAVVVKVVYLGHGAILPINKPLQRICTNGMDHVVCGVKVDEILCMWFELKSGIKEGDALVDRLVDPTPLGEGAQDLADWSSVLTDIRLLID
jgi:hypothetical protein